MNKDKLILQLREIMTYCERSDSQEFKAKDMIEEILKYWDSDW